MRGHSISKNGACETSRLDWITGDPLSLGTVLVPDVFRDVLSKSEVTVNRKDDSGFRMPSSYLLHRNTITQWQGDFTRRFYPSGQPWDHGYRFVGSMPYDNWVPIPVSNITPSLNMRSRCEVKCLLKVKDQKVHWANLMATVIGTVNTVSDPLLRVYKAYRAVKRGNLKAAAKLLRVPTPSKKGKDAASDWLALQYGWLPLLSDVYGTYEELRLSTLSRPFRFTTTSAIKETLPKTFLHNPDPMKNVGVTAHVRQTGFTAVKVCLTYETINTSLVNMSRTGMLNPLEVAWEVVPFSFIVDWVVPLGDWLSALSADSGLRFVSGSRTEFAKAERFGTAVGGRFYNGGSYMESKCSEMSAFTSFVSMERSVYQSTPFPIPYVKSPFSVAHAMNAVALIRSLT